MWGLPLVSGQSDSATTWRLTAAHVCMLASKHISAGAFYGLISFSVLLLLLFFLRVFLKRGGRLCLALQLECRSYLRYSDYFLLCMSVIQVAVSLCE